MKLKHYPAEKLKEDILKILNKYLDLSQYKVFSSVQGSKEMLMKGLISILALKAQKFQLT
jgi:septum formation topological specificity factor MinE